MSRAAGGTGIDETFERTRGACSGVDAMVGAGGTGIEEMVDRMGGACVGVAAMTLRTHCR